MEEKNYTDVAFLEAPKAIISTDKMKPTEQPVGEALKSTFTEMQPGKGDESTEIKQPDEDKKICSEKSSELEKKDDVVSKLNVKKSKSKKSGFGFGMPNFMKESKNTPQDAVEVPSLSILHSKKNKILVLKKKNLKKNGKKTVGVEISKTADGINLLLQVTREQSETVEALRSLQEDLRKKLGKKQKEKKWKWKPNLLGGGHKSLPVIPVLENGFFADAYNNTLDEVFHVWIHLFYFILNLKFNLFKLVKKEMLKPNVVAERKILTRAIECVKMFSKLKLNQLVMVMEEWQTSKEHQKNEMEIMEYKEKVLSQFLTEMEFMRIKVKELISQTYNPSSIGS